MMRKKLLLLCLLFAVLPLTTGCQLPAEELTQEPQLIHLADNEFMLAQLPELEPFSAFSEISQRYYDEYMDHLLPKDDYVQLFPYAGKIGLDKYYYARPVYGLCTADGRVVVDPVYSSCYLYGEDADQQLLLMYKPTDEINEAPWGSERVEIFSVAAPDGSWVTEELRDAYLVGADEQAFVICNRGRYLDDEESGEMVYDNNGERWVAVYNRQGERIFTITGLSCSGYNDGTLVLFSVDEQGNQLTSSIVDLEGRVIMEGLRFAEPFHGKYAAVSLAGEEKSLLIDRQGNNALAQSYSYIYFDEYSGHYHCGNPDSAEVELDEDGQVLENAKYPDSAYTLTDIKTGHEILINRQYDDTFQTTISDLDSGFSLTLPTDNSWLNYLSDGWCSYTDYSEEQNRMYLYRLGQDEALLQLDDADNCYLLQDDVLLVSRGREITDTNEEGIPYTYYQPERVSFVNLTTKEEFASIPGNMGPMAEGLGILIYPPNNWICGWLYDAQGKRLLEGGYYGMDKVCEGYWSVYGNIYTGLIDDEGKWIVRFCVNAMD